MKNLPSVKTLATIAGDRAKELRAVLEITKRSELESMLDLPALEYCKGSGNIFTVSNGQTTATCYACKREWKLSELASSEAWTSIIPCHASQFSTRYPVTRAWYRSCLHPMPLGLAKLSIADEIMNTHGVETIPAGKGVKSPQIEYCNSGDTYTTTLMYVSGRGYVVGDWGSIVERGNYS